MFSNFHPKQFILRQFCWLTYNTLWHILFFKLNIIIELGSLNPREQMGIRNVKHKLAAILSADLEGYSRLTSEDEFGTFRTVLLLSTCHVSSSTENMSGGN